MSSDSPTPIQDLQVDRENLYREEVFTDLRVATIRRLLPIRPDGSPDEAREVVYSGETQIMSQVGPVPVHCQIEARSLEEALEKFPEAIQRAVERLLDEARQLQQREASRIVVPQAPPPGKITLR